MPACAMATVPFECVRFFVISATPIAFPLDAAAPRPHSPLNAVSRERGSPHWTTNDGTARWILCPS
jgi:hypothetical protein